MEGSYLIKMKKEKTIQDLIDNECKNIYSILNPEGETLYSLNYVATFYQLNETELNEVEFENMEDVDLKLHPELMEEMKKLNIIDDGDESSLFITELDVTKCIVYSKINRARKFCRLILKITENNFRNNS